MIEPSAPPLALTIAFWLHMLATVIWIGGLAALALLVYPLARRSLDAAAFSGLVRRINKRLDPIGWLSLAVLTATGLMQMTASSRYEGLLRFTNAWSQAILIKHIVFFAILAASAYQTWGLAPAIERAALLRAKGKTEDTLPNLEKRENQLMQLNLALGVLVLLLTAWARVSA